MLAKKLLSLIAKYSLSFPLIQTCFLKKIIIIIPPPFPSKMFATSKIAHAIKTNVDLNIKATQHSAKECQNVQASFRFNDCKYLAWSQLVRTILKSKGKLSHLISPMPSEHYPKIAAWDKKDSMIMSWLWNSIQS